MHDADIASTKPATAASLPAALPENKVIAFLLYVVHCAPNPDEIQFLATRAEDYEPSTNIPRSELIVIIAPTLSKWAMPTLAECSFSDKGTHLDVKRTLIEHTKSCADRAPFDYECGRRKRRPHRRQRHGN